MVEVSRDGRRIYFTNSLYSPWDEQFYPDGVRSWMVKIDAHPKGGMTLDQKFFAEFDGLRAHQVSAWKAGTLPRTPIATRTGNHARGPNFHCVLAYAPAR